MRLDLGFSYISHKPKLRAIGKAVLLREQAAKRDREITRLGAALEVSRSQQFGAYQPTASLPPPAQVGPEGHLETSRTAGFKELPAARERIEQLELQVEYLQDHIDALEKVSLIFNEKYTKILKLLTGL
jgi:hypothetical protein